MQATSRRSAGPLEHCRAASQPEITQTVSGKADARALAASKTCSTPGKGAVERAQQQREWQQQKRPGARHTRGLNRIRHSQAQPAGQTPRRLARRRRRRSQADSRALEREYLEGELDALGEKEQEEVSLSHLSCFTASACGAL